MGDRLEELRGMADDLESGFPSDHDPEEDGALGRWAVQEIERLRPPEPRPGVHDVRAEVVRYMSAEGMCAGTNVMWVEDGQRRSARVPWVEDAAAARRRIEERRRGGQ